MLVVGEQFLLLIDVSIQDRAQQLQIYEIFNLQVSHTDMSARCKINGKYIGITYDKTEAVLNSNTQHACTQMASFARWTCHSRLLQILQYAQWS